MNLRALLLVLLLLAGLAPRSAQACGPYKLAFYWQGLLYYKDAQGRPGGIDKDLFDELVRRSGCTLQAVTESRVRTWDQMRRGLIHLTLSAIPTAEREEFAEFVPYSQARQYLLMRRELADRIPSMASYLADTSLTLGVVKGYAHGPAVDPWVQTLRDQGRVTEVGDYIALVRLFRAGRVQGMLAVPSSWPQVVAAFDAPTDIAMLDIAPNDRLVGAMAMSREGVSVADRQLLRRTLDAMVRDGTTIAIGSRYLGESAARASRYQPGN